jgi:hypothetical protein
MAVSTDTFSNLGGAVDSLFAGFAADAKAQGAKAEAKQYGISADLARRNAQFEQESTGVKVAQQNRTTFQMVGGAEADVAAAGFATSGSALDILRSNASQGALASAVLEKQGAITTAGYKEQATSYDIMQKAAKQAASADEDAGFASFISGGMKLGAAAFTLL